MAKVMSPDAPQYEASGLRAAERYYATMRSYSRQRVIKSAEQLCSVWREKTDVRWHEFAAGFMTGALAIAQTRPTDSEQEHAKIKFQPATIEVILTEDDRILHEGRKIAQVYHKREKPGGRWYVSFFYQAYRYWANWVYTDTPFTAKKTNEYQYHGADCRRRNPGGFSARMASAGRAEARIARRNGHALF